MSEVTLITYGGSDAIGEYIVFYQDGKAQQQYIKSASLPNDEQLSTIWNQGLKVDHLARGKAEWCTIYRKDEEGLHRDQKVEVLKDTEFSKLESKLSSHWQNGRVIVQVVFGDGKWVIVSEAAQEGQTPDQKLTVAENAFPEVEISENWDAGYFIKSSTYGAGKYALIFEKGDVPQSLYMDKEFPEEEIEDLWADCYSVSGLVYGDGKWVLISNEQTRNNHQGWVSDTLFPEEDLAELLQAGGLQPKLPPATQVQGISKTGWLMKGAPAKWKPWKKRWFVLSAKKRTCYYYKEQTDDRPKGYFFINGCTVGPCEDQSVLKKHPNTFQVAHPIRRTFNVQAPDKATHDEWVEEIQVLLDEDFDKKKTEIEKFVEDIFGDEQRLEWGVFIKRMKEILEEMQDSDEDQLHFVMHKLSNDEQADSNVVTVDQITAYVRAFGFVEDSFDKLGQIAEAFHGIKTHETAEAILEKAGRTLNSYIVWLDYAMSKVVISYVDKKKIEHKTVSWDYSADQFFVEEDVWSHDLPVVYRSIESCMQSNVAEWKAPVKSDMSSYTKDFESQRADFQRREAEEARRLAEEEARRREEQAAAAAAAPEKGKKSKSKRGKDKEAAGDDAAAGGKKKRGSSGKKKGGKQKDTGDAGGEKKSRAKGKKSKKK